MAAREDSDSNSLSTSLENLNVQSSSIQNDDDAAAASVDGGVKVSCFTEVIDDVTLHFQIIHLGKQIYAWIGCNSGKLGHLYAAAPTRPNNTANVTCVLGGDSGNTASGIARRLVLKTGLNIILASNVPKNNPMLEVNAEKKLVEKLVHLGYTAPKSKGSSS